MRATNRRAEGKTRRRRARGEEAGGLLPWLAEALRERLAVGAVLVCVPVSENRGLQVVAQAGALRPSGREFPLDETACAAVLSRGALGLSRGAGGRFPSDALIAGRGAAAFVGMRLEDGAGVPIGVLAVLNDRPIEPARLRRIRTQLRRIAPRFAIELGVRLGDGGLSCSLAHALNNLLGIVTGNAELIAGEAKEGSLAAECAAEILAAAGRAEALLRGRDLREPRSAPAPEPAHGQGVLVVEDEPGVRRMATIILEQAGLRPFPAADVRQASELLACHLADVELALVDLDLPDASGTEVIDRLRALCPELPVLVATGLPGPEARRVLGAAAVRGVVEKPYSIESFVPAVLAALSTARK